MKNAKQLYRYRQLQAKYQKLQQRLAKALQQGSFQEWAQRKKRQIQNRLQRYAQRLSFPSKLRRSVGSSLLLTGTLLSQSPNFLNGQIFEQDTDATPFGLPNIGQHSSPTFVDIDGDGDMDAFIGEKDGNINFFENVGPATSPNFSLISSDNAFGLPDIGYNSKPTFVDIDGDGDMDAFIGGFDGCTNFFRNTPSTLTPSIPAFSSEGGNTPFGLPNIGSDSSPTFVDIDGDGDMDAFIGEFDGSINFFRNTPSPSTPSIPAFSSEGGTEPFGLSKLNRYSSPTFVDIDGDGDMDAFIGEQFGNTYFFRNNAAAGVSIPAFSPKESNPFGLSYIGSFSSPTFVDIDGDGDMDAFIGEQDGNTNFFRNTEVSLLFSLDSDTEPFGLTSFPKYRSTPTFVDIDGDGDMDAFIGEIDGNTYFFRNTAAAGATIPAFSSKESNPFGLTKVGYQSSPTFVDIDGDGDMDAFIGERYGYTNFFRNTATVGASIPAFSQEEDNTPFGLTDVGDSSSPTFVDIDGDGDMDAFIREKDGNTNFFRNTATAGASIPVFSQEEGSTPFGLTDVGDYSSPTFVDIDGDGDMDAFIGEQYGSTYFFRNTGTSTAPAFIKQGGFTPFGLTDIGNRSTPTFVDIDGDGDLDAFIGEQFGSTYLFRNNGGCVVDLLISTSSNGGSHTAASQTVSTTGEVDIHSYSGTVIYQAGTSITLNSGFHAKTGSRFTAQIGTCQAAAPLRSEEEAASARQVPLSEPILINTPIEKRLTVFPNPAHQEIQIAYELQKASPVRIQVQTLNGQQIQLFSKSHATKGTYEARISIDHWPLGVYFIQLQTEDYLETVKLMVVE